MAAQPVGLDDVAAPPGTAQPSPRSWRGGPSAEFASALAVPAGYLRLLHQRPAVARRLLDLFGQSAYLSAELVRTPELLDQLVRQLPDGLYLKQVKQTGDIVNVTGYATSNARVSTLMRNIEGSPWLEKPELVVTRLIDAPVERVHQVGHQRALAQLLLFLAQSEVHSGHLS